MNPTPEHTLQNRRIFQPLIEHALTFMEAPQAPKPLKVAVLVHGDGFAGAAAALSEAADMIKEWESVPEYADAIHEGRVLEARAYRSAFNTSLAFRSIHDQPLPPAITPQAGAEARTLSQCFEEGKVLRARSKRFGVHDLLCVRSPGHDSDERCRLLPVNPDGRIRELLNLSSAAKDVVEQSWPNLASYFREVSSTT